MITGNSRLLFWIVGLSLLAAGAIKAVTVHGSVGAVALVLAGTVLVIVPSIIDRVEQFSVTSGGLEFRLTREISGLGGRRTAAILDRTDLANFAESYALIHEELNEAEHKDVKAYLLDLLVARSAGIASRERFDPEEVRALFRNGPPMIRVLMLGLMKGDPSLADGAAILSAVADARSRNEQYHGLHLALQCWHILSGSERRAMHSAIADSADILPSSDRRPLADAVLALPLN